MRIFLENTGLFDMNKSAKEILSNYYPKGFLIQLEGSVGEAVELGEPEMESQNKHSKSVRVTVRTKGSSLGEYVIDSDMMGIRSITYRGLHPLAHEGQTEISLQYSRGARWGTGYRRVDEWKKTIQFPMLQNSLNLYKRD